jgi:hypothetical protein
MAHKRIRKFNTKHTYPEQKLDNDLAQAVVTQGGKIVWLRGQCAQNLDDAVSIDSHDPVQQTHKVMQNVRQLIEEAGGKTPRYLIRDRDRVYGAAAMRRLRAMGIRDKPIAPGSPWRNGFAERLIGSIRRECVDHIVVLGETHLRRILKSYARYYNETRTHRSLDKDAPISRPVQRTGGIISHALLGGLHHHYVRV